MMNLHLIIPMAGEGSRFALKGYLLPKPLIEINNRPFFYWATQSIVKFINVKSLTFVVLREHVEHFKIDKEIISLYHQAEIIILESVLPGALLTCLAGAKNIIDDSPVLFNDCDHMFMSSDFNSLVTNCCENTIDFDGALLTFESNSNRYSFIKYGAEGNIIGTVEKKVVSNKAICGAYYIRNAAIFRDVSDKYLRSCKYEEYFMSGIYNILYENGKTIKTFDTDFHISFGTPEEYEYAIHSSKFHFLDRKIGRC